jgi:TatD DNase family protein
MSYKIKLVDSHSHVHFDAFKDDVGDVLERAREAGVAMVTVGTMQKTSRGAVAFAADHENIWAAVGLHPNNIHFILPSEDEGSGREDFDYNFYLELARDPNVVAIGETGMDAYRIPDGFEREEVLKEQERVFRLHLDLCDELGKPVIIHVRDAHEEVTRVLREYVSAGKLARRGIMHCFTGTPEQARAYVELGMYVSIPGIITFPPKKGETENSLIAAMRIVPRDRLLVETDCPYLAPVPHRGVRNEPSFVVHTATEVGRLWGVSYDEVAAQTTENALRIFNIDHFEK